MKLTAIVPGVPNLLLLLLIDSCLIFQSMLCKRLHAKDSGTGGRGNSSPSSGKKKVVIIGEMSDLAFDMATNASASTNYALDDVTFADYDPQPNPYQSEDHESHHQHDHHRYPGSKYGLSDSRGKIHRIRPWVGKRTASGISPSPGSVFVPVAAYSVTHSRVGAGPGGVRRMRPGKTTESAVYGYVQKPEIVEFRGQYFYGPNPSPGVSSSPHYHSHYSPIPVSSHHHYSPSGLTASASDSVASSASSWIPWSSGSSSKISHKSGGLGPGGLLLATLPLILAPMLSYLFTPMVIPVTATIAAGRRRRRRGIRDDDDRRRRPFPHEDDHVAFSTTSNSSITTSPAFNLSRLTPTSPESGTMTDSFFPRTSQNATPIGFHSIKTMNLSGARRRNGSDGGAAAVAGATRQSPMSHHRAIVSAIMKRAEQSFSNHNVSMRQASRHHWNRKLHKRQSPG